MFDLKNLKNNPDLANLENFFQDLFPENLFQCFEGKMMRVDIQETENAYILDIDIPGATKEEINLSVNDDIINIHVAKKCEATREEENFLVKERRFGSMSRSFSLPNVDKDHIKATYENGVLHVILPKLNISQKKINID